MSKRKRIFLVDTENVGPLSIEKILGEDAASNQSCCPEQDKLQSLIGTSSCECNEQETEIYYFVSANVSNKKLKKEANKPISSSVSVFEKPSETGHKNAMDFQIVAFAEYLVNTNDNSEIVICSCDEGYDPAIHLMNALGGHTARKNPKNGSIQPALTNIVSEQQKIESFLQQRKFDVKFSQAVAACFQGCKDLVEVHSRIQKQYGEEMCKKFYAETTKGERKAMLAGTI